MEPIVVKFVRIPTIDWPVVVALSGLVIAAISLATAREYLKAHRLPASRQQPRGLQMWVDPSLDLGPDPHAAAVGRVYLKAAVAGAVLAAAGFVWMLV